MEYSVGQKIEVIGKDEGFEGSYYAAKVISKENPTNLQYKIEYFSLLKEDESGPLQELLPPDLIRPFPPNIPNDSFSLEEVVDAYFNDGWWIGLIKGKFTYFNAYLYFLTVYFYKIFQVNLGRNTSLSFRTMTEEKRYGLL